jgi:acetyl esterase/lipase
MNHPLCLCLLCATSVMAQSRFTEWDRNGDGRLSRDELPEAARKIFSTADQNGDGFISPAEDAAMRQRNASAPPALPPGVRRVMNLDYVGNGNPRQMLDLYLPKKTNGEKPPPLVIWIHGGAWRSGGKEYARLLGEVVATGDFIGAAINYRLSDEAIWPAQIHDCKAAIRWLRAHAQQHGYDPERIAVIGSSAGGHLAAMLGVTCGEEALEGSLGKHGDQSSDVATVVNFFGPADFLTMQEPPTTEDHNAASSPESRLIGGAIQQHPEKARAASPLTYVSAGDRPILIIHGTRDLLVPYSQSVRFEKALEAAGVATTLITVEGGGHGSQFGPQVNALALQYLKNLLHGEQVALPDQILPAASK